MTDTPHIEWPREIWMAEREEHDQGIVSAVLSEWATIARWDGDKERDRDFHRYVDADIYDSAEKYWREQRSATQAKLDKAMEALRAIDGKVCWEISPANYTHSDVCDLNSDWCEVGNIATRTLAELEGK